MPVELQKLELSLWNPHEWPINQTLNDSGHRYLFSLRVTKVQSQGRTKPELKNVMFYILGDTIPQYKASSYG